MPDPPFKRFYIEPEILMNSNGDNTILWSADFQSEKATDFSVAFKFKFS